MMIMMMLIIMINDDDCNCDIESDFLKTIINEVLNR